LNKDGHEVIALTRSIKSEREIFGTEIKPAEWNGKDAKGWSEFADGALAIVNLAGENIGSSRWTAPKRQTILQSRLDAGHAVTEAVKSAKIKPRVVIQASAVGFYGSRDDNVMDESSSPGKGFLTDVTKEWERSTQEVESFNVRRVIIRSGVVLGKDKGALQRLAKPFRFFMGGPLGNGKQWFSWIHLEDELNAIIFLLTKEILKGVFNLTAPSPVVQRDFAQILGKTLGRPSWLSVPSFMLRLGLGKMADEMVLVSQRVAPQRLLESGYQFLFPGVESALKDIL
jgi:uncharacterized protein (TIGR01777 family)